MPFRSAKQRRLFYALHRRGDMDPSTIERWNEETKAMQDQGKLPKKLPRYVADMKKTSALDPRVLFAQAMQGAMAGAIAGSRRSLDDKTLQGVAQGAAIGALGGMIGGQIQSHGSSEPGAAGALAGGGLAGWLASRGPRGESRPQLHLRVDRGTGRPLPSPAAKTASRKRIGMRSKDEIVSGLLGSAALGAHGAALGHLVNRDYGAYIGGLGGLVLGAPIGRRLLGRQKEKRAAAKRGCVKCGRTDRDRRMGVCDVCAFGKRAAVKTAISDALADRVRQARADRLSAARRSLEEAHGAAMSAAAAGKRKAAFGHAAFAARAAEQVDHHRDKMLRNMSLNAKRDTRRISTGIEALKKRISSHRESRHVPLMAGAAAATLAGAGLLAHHMRERKREQGQR